ncbi:MAG: hypothetical protein KIS91_20375, partial [Anaerolineae bacterium]|nr:hypothetical protein [Anaerolineae bacterium]
MTRSDSALLDRVFRTTVPVERVGAQIRQILNIEDEYLGLMQRYASERAAFENADLWPESQARYKHRIGPILRAIQDLLGRVNGWLTVSLLEAKWVGFGIRVPMEVDPRHTLLLPRWWMLLNADCARGFAEGGGLRYERLYVSDLSQLSPHEAAKLPGVLEAYTRRLCTRATGGGDKKRGDTVDPRSIGLEFATAVDQAVNRRLQGMLGA